MSRVLCNEREKEPVAAGNVLSTGRNDGSASLYSLGVKPGDGPALLYSLGVKPGGRALEGLTASQHYDLPSCVLTQEWLHEIVAHREQFGGWKDRGRDQATGPPFHNGQSK